MKRTKLLKSILIPTLGISAVGTIVAISTSCSCNSHGGVDIKVQSILLNKNETTLVVVETETLTATVSPDDATNKDVTWTSSDANIATIKNGTITAKGLGKAIITVTSVDNQNAKATCEVNVINPYVTIVANEDSTLTLNNNGDNNHPDLQYSADGINWNEYSESGEISIPSGTQLYLKGNNPEGWSHGVIACSTLLIEGDVSISGNVMGLLDNGVKPGEQGNITDIPCDWCFYRLFAGSTGIKSISEDFLWVKNLSGEACYAGMFMDCTSLTTAPKLPAIKNLVNGCYFGMFENCTSLTAVPELPATTLASDCYLDMFNGCTSLTTAPELPAIHLANACYENMFRNCKSLIKAPELPAITLASDCYSGMFWGCTSLTTAPELPATTLTNDCYSNMFQGCSSLTAAQELPAKSLANNCYESMFQGCSSLKSIKIGYTGNYNYDYFNNWVNGVAPTGTFYYNGSQTAEDFKLPSYWDTQPFN